MAKARRMMEDSLRQVDVVVEIVDARAPLATRNPDFDALFARKSRVLILNKADLALDAQTQEWKAVYAALGYQVLPFCAKARNAVKQAIALVESAAKPLVEKQKKRGIQKTVRAMVVGIPNVGKSTFINALRGVASAKTGDQPGVTRGKQWIVVHSHLEFLDTPGLLWPKLEDQALARHLAYIGSINDEIFSMEEICALLFSELRAFPERYGEALCQRLKQTTLPETGEEMLRVACAGRGFLQRNGELDMQRASRVLLDEFRAGKMGKVTLEDPALYKERVSKEMALAPEVQKPSEAKSERIQEGPVTAPRPKTEPVQNAKKPPNKKVQGKTAGKGTARDEKSRAGRSQPGRRDRQRSGRKK